ncbi:MAG: thioredoxin-dependent thiol peroxidase [Actinomycetota bacterium]|jgi:peroxiredoxin Q/BCP|nr:thioredoxin-dependent thiol peroxidase [Actinomycetota bacterium]
MTLQVGAVAPQFTLTDQRGDSWSLREHRGRAVVLYFYPKDDTPGCTTQACDIRDNWGEFSQLGVAVAGISPDDHHSHSAFAARFELPHTLLADPQRKAIDKYGAWGEKSMYGKRYEGVLRSSFVIDAYGKVAAIFDRIQPKQQSSKALAVVKELATR